MLDSFKRAGLLVCLATTYLLAPAQAVDDVGFRMGGPYDANGYNAVTGSYLNPHDPAPGSQFVVMDDRIAALVQLKYGLPQAQHYPLAGITIFPNQSTHADFNEFMTSKFFGLPIAFGQVRPTFYTNLPSNDFVRISIPLTPRSTSQPNTKLAQRPDRADETPWLVAHQNGTSFGLVGNRDAVLMVSAGTIYHVTGPDEVTVKSGRIWAFSGQKALHVVTKYGTTLVRPYSITALEQNCFGKVKVATLVGKTSELKTMHNGESSTYSIEAGHELALSDTLVAAAGTSDFVASSRLPQATVPNLAMTTRKVDGDVSPFIKEFKTQRPPLPNMAMIKRYDQLLTQYGVLAQALSKPTLPTTAKPSAYSASLDARYFVPVFKPKKAPAATAPAEPQTEQALKTAWLKRGVAKYLSNSDVEIDSFDRVFLNSGEVVVCANDSVRVNAGNAHVYLDKGAIALITRKKNILIVRNLKEMHAKNVRVSVSGRITNCSAGYEVIIGNSVSSVSAELAHDGVQRRNVQLSEVDKGTVAVNKCEYSMTTLLQNNPTLVSIYRSNDHHDKKIADAVIKMDACLTLVTGGKGQYSKLSTQDM